MEVGEEVIEADAIFHFALESGASGTWWSMYYIADVLLQDVVDV